jgi:16S rRNA G966 N2-methylase RsmD
VNKLVESLKYTEDCCCLTTPSLGHGFHVTGREEVVLDIDRRFEYLPKFRYFDILSPVADTNESFRIIIMDPPFFYISMAQIYAAVMCITNGSTTNTKLMIGFLRREERQLLEMFRDFNLKPTNFALEYATVKPNKWKNYTLYSNVDLPGIKRVSS